MVRDCIECRIEVHAVVISRVDQHAIVFKCRIVDIDVAAIGRRYHLHDRQIVLLGELPVARVVTGNRHDSTRAITHKNEIRDPQRHFVAGQWMDRGNAERHSLFLHRLEGRLGRIGLLAFFNECSDIGIFCGRLQCQWMLRRDRHVGHAHERIGPCRVNSQQVVVILYLE